jgi:hypothetical protein
MIDPETTNAWLFRVSGPYASAAYRDFLRQGASLCPPRPDNLVAQQVISDNQYQVRGRLWTNTQPTAVFYRVSSGTRGNPFANATGTTAWTAPLAPYLVAGTSNQYTFEVYATFADGLISGTNCVLFNYQPAGTPPLPRITSLQVSSGFVNLTITNLSPGLTNQIERRLGLGLTDGWTLLTNFVGAGPGTVVSDLLHPSWSKAFYRVTSKP